MKLYKSFFVLSILLLNLPLCFSDDSDNAEDNSRGKGSVFGRRIDEDSGTPEKRYIRKQSAPEPKIDQAAPDPKVEQSAPEPESEELASEEEVEFIDVSASDDSNVSEWASEFEELYHLREEYEKERIRIGEHMNEAVEKLRENLFSQMDHGIRNLTKSMRLEDAAKLKELKDSFPAIFFIEEPDDYPMELSIFIKYSQRLFQPLLKKENNSFRVLKIKYERKAKALLKKQADAGALENALLVKEFIEEIEALPLSQFDTYDAEDAEFAQGADSRKKVRVKMKSGLACRVFPFVATGGMNGLKGIKSSNAPSEAVVVSQGTIAMPDKYKDRERVWTHFSGEIYLPRTGQYQFYVEDLAVYDVLSLSVNGEELFAIEGGEKKSGLIQYNRGWYPIDVWYYQYRGEKKIKLSFGVSGDMRPITSKDLRHREDSFEPKTPPRVPTPQIGFKRGLKVKVFKGSRGIEPWNSSFSNSYVLPESSFHQEVIMPMISIPDTLKDTDCFGLHFKGYFWIPKTGNYSFHIFADDRARLCINGEVIGEHSNGKGEIQLERGWIPIEVWHVERIGGERVWLKYGLEGEELVEMPQECFVHKDESLRRHLR